MSETSNLIQIKSFIEKRVELEIKQNNIKEKDRDSYTLSRYNPALEREASIARLVENIEQYFVSPYRYESNVFLLDGTWGTGKSWVLNFTRDYVREEEGEYTWVDFSAWQYLSEKELFFDIFDYLHKPSVAKSIIKGLEGDPEKQKRILNGMATMTKEGIKLVGRNKEIFKKVVVGTISTLSHFAVPGSGLVTAPLAKLAVDFADGFLTENLQAWNIGEGTVNSFIANTEVLRDIAKDVSGGDKKSIIENYSQFAIPKNQKFVFVIDDLDRCHETKLWRIFTMLSLFDKQDQVLFILGGSSQYLIQILEKKYHVEGEGENFLTKFIGYQISLDEISYVDLIVSKSTQQLENSQSRTILDKYFLFDSYRDFKTNFMQGVNKYDSNVLDILILIKIRAGYVLPALIPAMNSNDIEEIDLDLLGGLLSDLLIPKDSTDFDSFQSYWLSITENHKKIKLIEALYFSYLKKLNHDYSSLDIQHIVRIRSKVRYKDSDNRNLQIVVGYREQLRREFGEIKKV